MADRKLRGMKMQERTMSFLVMSCPASSSAIGFFYIFIVQRSTVNFFVAPIIFSLYL